MSLQSKIEVEPLSEARMSKIRRGVFDRLDAQRSELVAMPVRPSRSSRRPGYLAAAIVAAILVVGLTWRAGHPQRAAFVDSPTRIVTGASDSHLALGESSVDVRRGSVLLVNGDDDRGMLLILERGTILCDVAPRRGRPAFVVQAGAVRVRVVGTHFTVTRVEDSARVDVAHGTVEVNDGGRTTLVNAGESWGPTAAGQVIPSDVPSAAPMPTRPPVDDLRPSKRAIGARVPAVSSEASSRPTAESSTETRSAAPPIAHPAAETAAPTLGRATDTAPVAPAPTQTAASHSEGNDQQLFEQATELEQQDPSRALAIYARLAAGTGPWAANALFAQGRLESDRGNLVEGRRLLGNYLSRYPRGPNAADARLLLDRPK